MAIFLEPVQSSVGILEDFYWKFGKCRRQKTVLFGSEFFRSGTSNRITVIDSNQASKENKVGLSYRWKTFKNPIFGMNRLLSDSIIMDPTESRNRTRSKAKT